MKTFFLFLIFSLSILLVANSQDLSLLVQSKHNEAVLQSKYSYDGEWIATSDAKNKIILWDSKTKKKVKTLINNGFPAKALIFHPSKNILVSSCDKTLIVWDIYSGKIKRIFKTEHSGTITSIDFSRDGKYLASGSIDETVIIWKFENGKMKKSLKQKLFYNNEIYSVKFSKYGDYIFTAGEDINVNMWDWKKNKIIKKFKHHKYRINNIALNNTNSLIASASNDSKVNVWNINTGKRIASFKLPNSPVQNVVFHPTKDRVVASYYKNYTDSSRLYTKQRVEGRIIMWDINKLKIIWDKKMEGGILDINISPDKESFITANSDANVKIIKLSNGRINHSLGTETQINDFLFIPERNEFVTAVNNGIIKIWDSKKLNVKGLLETKIPDKVSAIDYDYSSGNLIAAIGTTILIWNYDYAQKKYLLVNTFKLPEGNITEVKLTDGSTKIFVKRKLSYNKFNLETLDAYKKGIIPEDLINNIDSQIVEVYNIKGDFLFNYNNVLHKNILFASNDDSNKIAYNGVSNQILECDYNQSLTNKQDIKEQKKSNSPNNLADNLKSNAFKLSSSLSAATKNTTKAKRVKKEKRVKNTARTLKKEAKRLKKINTSFSVENNKYKHIKYSIDGKYLGSSGLFDYIEVFNLEKKKLKKIGKFTENVNYFEFSSDNTMLATISGNKIQIWNVQNGALETQLITVNSLSEIHFFEENKKLLTYGLDDGIKIWNIANESLLATVISVGKTDFITISNDLYYLNSEKGAKGVAFFTDETVIPIECLRMKYSRPEIVMSKLGFNNESIIEDYSNEYNKNLKKFGLENNDFDLSHIPSIKIQNSRDFKWYTYNKFIDLNISASDLEQNLKKIKIQVNGVPILNEKQRNIGRYKKDEYTHNYKIELNKGKNVIYTYVTNNKGAESIKDSLVITYKIKKNAVNKKPNLYIIALGTYNFIENNVKTDLTLESTKELIEILRQNKQTKFNKIIIDTLYGKQALKYKLLKLKRKYRHVKVDDQFIVISAGYSVLKNNFDVYFATHNMDFNKPEKNGIPHTLINNMLLEIPSRKKILIVDSWRFIQNTVATNLANKKDKNLADITYTSYDPAQKMRKNIFKEMYKTSGTSVLFIDKLSEKEQKVSIIEKTISLGYNRSAADYNKNGIISSYELNYFINLQKERSVKRDYENKIAVYREL